MVIIVELGPQHRSLGPESILLHLTVEIRVQAVPSIEQWSFYLILKPHDLKT